MPNQNSIGLGGSFREESGLQNQIFFKTISTYFLDLKKLRTKAQPDR